MDLLNPFILKSLVERICDINYYKELKRILIEKGATTGFEKAYGKEGAIEKVKRKRERMNWRQSQNPDLVEIQQTIDKFWTNLD